MALQVGQASVSPAGRIAGARRPVVFWLAALTLVLLPLEWWLLPYGLKIVDLGLVLLVAGGSLSLLLKRRPVRLPLLIPFWLILLASAIATLTGLNFADSALAMTQELYLYVWFVVLANLLVRFPEKHFEALLKLWSLIALAEATATLLGMLHLGPAMFHTNPNQLVALSGNSLDRGLGTFANPNAAATYLFISFFVLLAARWPVWITALAAAWLLLGMFATGSIGALLATVAGFGALVLAAFPQKTRPVIAVLALLGGVSLILLLTSAWPTLNAGAVSVSDLYHTTIGRLPRSLMSRFGLIQRVWPLYMQSPLGIGPNASAAYFGSLHNDYFAFLVERGPLGLIGWLWMVGAVLAQPLHALRRVADRSGNRAWVILALAAGFLAVALNAFTHELSHFRQVWMLIAFLIAACWRMRTPS